MMTVSTLEFSSARMLQYTPSTKATVYTLYAYRGHKAGRGGTGEREGMRWMPCPPRQGCHLTDDRGLTLTFGPSMGSTGIARVIWSV